MAALQLQQQQQTRQVPALLRIKVLTQRLLLFLPRMLQQRRR
jgi:hypothetical protein